jgi:antitoxin HicB
LEDQASEDIRGAAVSTLSFIVASSPRCLESRAIAFGGGEADLAVTMAMKGRAMARQKVIAASEHSYNVVLQPEPEGGYTVTCPSLPGVVTYGETLEEARTMAAEAIEAYLESLQIDGEPLPAGIMVAPLRARGA